MSQNEKILWWIITVMFFTISFLAMTVGVFGWPLFTFAAVAAKPSDNHNRWVNNVFFLVFAIAGFVLAYLMQVSN